MIDITTEKLITLARAARQLGMGWQAVRRLIDRGLLEAVELPMPTATHPGKVRVKTSLEALQRYVQDVQPAQRPQTEAQRRRDKKETEEILKKWRM